MTTIEYNANDRIIRCVGHAGYAEKGKDIVCAAISATMRMVVTAAISDGHTPHISKGTISVSVDETSYGSTAVMRTAVVCFKLLERDFPEHVRVIEDKR